MINRLFVSTKRSFVFPCKRSFMFPTKRSFMCYKYLQMMAEIFQDLLCNRDDYLRALRALLREIVRSLRHDMNFPNFALGLMTSRKERKFTEMEPALKVRT